MTTLAVHAVQLQAASFAQQVGTAVARQQIDAQRAIADLVGATAASSRAAPPGQGRTVDIRV